MSKLFVREYANVVNVNGQTLPVGAEPAVAIQVLEIGSASTVSAPLHPATRFVGLYAEVPCTVAIGKAPEATENDIHVAGNSLFPIIPVFKIAARVAVPSDSHADHLLALLADPEVAKERLAELTQKEADAEALLAKAKATIDEANSLAAMSAKIKKDLDAREQALNERLSALNERERRLAKGEADLLGRMARLRELVA